MIYLFYNLDMKFDKLEYCKGIMIVEIRATTILSKKVTLVAVRIKSV